MSEFTPEEKKLILDAAEKIMRKPGRQKKKPNPPQGVEAPASPTMVE